MPAAPTGRRCEARAVKRSQLSLLLSLLAATALASPWLWCLLRGDAPLKFAAMFQHLAPHQPICAAHAVPTTRCAPPRRGFHNGTVSITSIGGVASTFVLKWLKALQNAHHKQLECEESSAAAGSCSCPAIGAHTLPRQVVSCHVDDDGVFKHLADPRALNRFPHHRAVYIVGDPLHAVTSVFRRNFQCWQLYRLHNCWFSRAQREGVIPCAQPGIQSFRRRRRGGVQVPRAACRPALEPRGVRGAGRGPLRQGGAVPRVAELPRARVQVRHPR